MNLLTGIAVSDVGQLREESEYRILRMQIEYAFSAKELLQYAQCFMKCCICIKGDKMSRNKSGSAQKPLQPATESHTLQDLTDDRMEWNTKWDPIEQNYDIIPNTVDDNRLTQELKKLVDIFVYGPLNKEHCMSELNRIQESKKELWFLVPNIEWRKDSNKLIGDTATSVKEIRKENDQIKRQNQQIKYQHAETKQKLQSIRRHTKEELQEIKSQYTETKQEYREIKIQQTEARKELEVIKNQHAESKRELHEIKEQNTETKEGIEEIRDTLNKLIAIMKQKEEMQK